MAFDNIRRMVLKPVYVINGFLDAGKTDFMSYTISQPYFQAEGRTLLIVCEEGENEYDESLLRQTNTVAEYVDSLEALTPQALMEMDSRHDPERILIEFNGMWDYRKFRLPRKWRLEQQITVIDTSHFELYFNNMKSLLAEQIRGSDLILFNRCDSVMDSLAVYKRNVRAINQKADIVFEGESGEIDVTLDEDLPFDLNADVIELNNFGYGMFFLDALEHVSRYEGKKVRFRAMVAKPPELGDKAFVPGRMAMTCCAQDMQFLGFKCEYEDAAGLAEKSWVDVTARIRKDYAEEYGGEGPVLEAVEVVPADEPGTPVIDFSNPDE